MHENASLQNTGKTNSLCCYFLLTYPWGGGGLIYEVLYGEAPPLGSLPLTSSLSHHHLFAPEGT